MKEITMDDYQFLDSFKKKRIQLTLRSAAYAGTVQRINLNNKSVLLGDVVDVKSGRKFAGMKLFFGHEILNVELPHAPKPEQGNKEDHSRSTEGQLPVEFQPYRKNIKLDDDEDDGEYVDFVVIDEFFEKFGPAVMDIRKQQVIGIGADGVGVSQHERLCWLQIASKTRVYLFDILLLGARAFKNGLSMILESGHILKVTHDCRGIAGCLWTQYGVNLCNVFDTQVADVMSFHAETGGFLPDRVSTVQEVLALHLKMSPACLASLKVKSQLTKEDSEVWYVRPCPVSLLKVMALSVIHLQPLRMVLLDALMADYTGRVDCCLSVSREEPVNTQSIGTSSGLELPAQLRELESLHRQRRQWASARYPVTQGGLLIRSRPRPAPPPPAVELGEPPRRTSGSWGADLSMEAERSAPGEAGQGPGEAGQWGPQASGEGPGEAGQGPGEAGQWGPQASGEGPGEAGQWGPQASGEGPGEAGQWGPQASGEGPGEAGQWGPQASGEGPGEAGQGPGEAGQWGPQASGEGPGEAGQWGPQASGEGPGEAGQGPAEAGQWGPQASGEGPGEAGQCSLQASGEGPGEAGQCSLQASGEGPGEAGQCSLQASGEGPGEAGQWGPQASGEGPGEAGQCSLQASGEGPGEAGQCSLQASGEGPGEAGQCSLQASGEGPGEAGQCSLQASGEGPGELSPSRPSPGLSSRARGRPSGSPEVTQIPGKAPSGEAPVPTAGRGRPLEIAGPGAEEGTAGRGRLPQREGAPRAATFPPAGRGLCLQIPPPVSRELPGAARLTAPRAPAPLSQQGPVSSAGRAGGEPTVGAGLSGNASPPGTMPENIVSFGRGLFFQKAPQSPSSQFILSLSSFKKAGQ